MSFLTEKWIKERDCDDHSRRGGTEAYDWCSIHTECTHWFDKRGWKYKR